ncbi:MAG TPA: hypothetical protein VMD09_08945 [Solirubrobacteraceae bacterium]|nr:hypothetical protein [Solirubrobacteraceae bacterium]
MTLIASFLTGSLLSLLIPAGLLIALVWWYLAVIRKVPESATGADAVPPTQPGQGTDVPVADPGPSVAVSDEVNRIP